MLLIPGKVQKAHNNLQDKHFFILTGKQQTIKTNYSMKISSYFRKDINVIHNGFALN